MQFLKRGLWHYLKPVACVLTLLLPFALRAQNTQPLINSTLHGTVLDAVSKQPLPGAGVAIKGTTHAVSTDRDGKFSFVTGQKFPYTLVITFIGYERQELVANGSPVEVLLKENNQQLSEVVVTDGYSTQTKKAYTGSAVSVKGAENENKPFSTPLGALQGQVAGLNIAIANGQPGANAQVRLRGLGSTALNSNPLYVIDGMIINSGDLSRLATTSNVLAGINNDDIEDITVLKDASATAIYGSRGSNGVIIITTKKGKAGRTQVRLDAEAGSTNMIDLPEAGKPLNADQFKELFLEGLRNANYSAAEIASLADSYGLNSGKSNDWKKLTFRNGSQQQYNVSINGGNENTRIFSSLGYFRQEATTLASSFKRITGLLNVDHKISKRVSLSAGLNFSNVFQLTPVGAAGSWANPVFASSILRPFQLAYNDDGTLNSSSTGNLGYVAHYNTLYIAEYDKYNLSQTRALGNTTLKWDIWKKLKFTSYASIDYNVLEENQYNNPVLGGGLTTQGAGYSYYTRYFNWLSRNQLDYRLNIPGLQDTYLEAAVGYEAQRSNQFIINAAGTGYPLTQPDLSELANAATPTTASANSSSYAFNSVYSRLNFNYQNRYSLSASYRRDGSSVFGINNQYGSFWSVGGAWNIDQEKFFGDLGALSAAKLRASYGTTGNAQGIGNYSARALASYGSNYTGGNGQNYSVVGNPDLTWEKQKKLDLGIDIGFFNDRLAFSADVYKNDIDGLIQAVSISRTTGFSTVSYANSGAMRNKGLELAIKGVPIRTQSFNWTTNFNIAFNQNRVTKLGNASGANGNYYLDQGYDYYTYYTRLWAGVNPANGEALWYTDASQTATTNNYSVAARVPYKSAAPKYFGGFSNSFTYKGVNLTADFYYNFGNYIVDGWGTRFLDGAYYTFNKYQYEYWNRWTTPGQVTDVPKYIAGGGTQSTSNSFSTRFLYKGDFIRLKNVSLGYDLKNLAYFKNLRAVSKVYLYGRATNLWTKTYDDRLPYDPESGTVTIPQYRTFTIGLNIGL